MKTIKSPKADLETKRFLFFEIGCIIALGVILISFGLRTFEKQEIDFNYNKLDIEQEEMIEITQQEKPLPPPPAPFQSTSIIEIVENDTEVEDELEIDVEIDQETMIEPYVPIFFDEIEDEENQEENLIFVIVESMPDFPGGDSTRLWYLKENIKYPSLAREAGIQGVVYVTFVVEKNGQIRDVKVLRGIGGGCDEEAIRVVESMPNWIPGKQRNVPVRVQFNMPIRFVLL